MSFSTLHDIGNLLGMSACRLLTLVGPGGVGKTRLAIEAARRLVDSAAYGEREALVDEGYFIPLQPLTSPDFIVPNIADTLNFTFYGEGDPKSQLLHYLREKRVLFLLDNFEHLLDGADQLPEILEHAPGVKLLVTSRERLRLREEWVLDVHGLPFPAKGLHIGLGDYPSAQLFMQSARRTGYSPATGDAASIARICQLTEGVPLAIELAAAWVRVMPCATIASEIERSLDILTTTTRNVPEKHRSMRATFEHSWKLLSADEQQIFRRLSVFRGGFTREAAEQVAGATLAILASLVDRSLLQVDTRGRYDLHELLRQYAFDQLSEADETQAILDRHQGYFLAFAERAEPELIGPNQIDWFERVETERGNLRAAISWSVERGDIAAGLCLTGSLYWFWSQHGHHREGYEQLMSILSLPAAKGPTIMRAKALNAAGCIQWFEGNYAEARLLLEEAISIAREVGDLQQLTLGVRFLGQVLYNMGEQEAGGRLLEESLELSRTLQDRFGLAWSLVLVGEVVLLQGDLEQAQRLNQEGIELLRAVEDKGILAFAVRRLGLVMRGYEAYDHAKTLCQESLELNVVIGDRRGVAASLIGLAGLAVEQAHTMRAAQLLAAAEQLLEDMAAHLLFLDQLEYERHLKSVRAQLDTPTFHRVWTDGQSMTLEQAIAYARESQVTSDQQADESIIDQPARQSLPESLTERELEILRLLSSGLSTREVAQQLFLSTGTVRWYLNQIYSKLQVHSRTQALTRARELKLLE